MKKNAQKFNKFTVSMVNYNHIFYQIICFAERGAQENTVITNVQKNLTNLKSPQ